MSFALNAIAVVAKLFGQWFAFCCRSFLRQTNNLNLVDVHAEEVEDIQIVEQTVVPLKVNAFQVFWIHSHNTRVSVRLANLEDGLQFGLVIETECFLVAVVVHKLDVNSCYLVELFQTMLSEVQVEDVLVLYKKIIKPSLKIKKRLTAKKRLMLSSDHEEALSVHPIYSLVNITN